MNRMAVTPHDEIDMALDAWASWTRERMAAEGLADEERELLAAWHDQQEGYAVDPDTDRCPFCAGIAVYDEARQHLACEACHVLLREVR